MERIKNDTELKLKYNEYYRKLWHKNKNKIKKQIQIRIQRNKKYVLEYLSTHPCVDCGETRTICLNFHHTRDKIDILSNMVRGHSIERIKAEIKKCIILCRNCHNKMHAEERDQTKIDILETGRAIQKIRCRKRKREYAENYKKDHPCSCGETDPRCLIFHHKKPSSKEAKVSSLYNKSWDRMKIEIEKCTVMCANCHILFHYVSKYSITSPPNIPDKNSEI